MKIFTFLRSFLILVVIGNLGACSRDAAKQNYSAGLTNNNATAKTLSNSDIRFLFDAHNIALYNIHLSSEAQIRSTAAESVNMATEIISDNQNLLSSINEVAEKHNVQLPNDITEEQKQAWKEMVKKKGWEFDTHFSSLIGRNLYSTETLFKEAGTVCKEDAVKEIATGGLSQLREHEELVTAQRQKIQDRTCDAQYLAVGEPAEKTIAKKNNRKN